MFEFLDPGILIDDDLQLVLLEKASGDPDIGLVPAYKFKMTLVGQDVFIGHIDLRIGNTNHIVMYGGHIGYGTEPAHRGHRYAARACKLLVPLARSHGLDTIWITCNPENIASRRTCEILGCKLVEIVDLPANTDMYRDGERQKCRYRLDLMRSNSQ